MAFWEWKHFGNFEKRAPGKTCLNSVLVCTTDLTGEEEVKRKRQGEGTCRNLIKYGNFTSWLPEWV